MKWEYKTVNFAISQPPHPTKVERLNELGQEGWELIWIKDGDYYFKRPIYSVLHVCCERENVTVTEFEHLVGDCFRKAIER